MTFVRTPAALSYAVAAAILAADQATKAWIIFGLGLGRRVSVPVWGPLWLTLVQNKGISFGLFQSDSLLGRLVLAGFSTAVVAFMAIWVRRSDRLIMGVIIGLIMGGAIGNVLDRVRFGSVVDFIDVQRLFFPWVFNVADSAISIGIVLLLLDSFIVSRPRVR